MTSLRGSQSARRAV